MHEFMHFDWKPAFYGNNNFLKNQCLSGAIKKDEGIGIIPNLGRV
jgi:hypothetical protein